MTMARAGLWLMAWALAVPAASAQAGAVEVGVGQAEFALPEGVPLAGYSKRHGQPSTGRHDPVGARAFVARDAQTLIVLVSCDLLIIDEELFGLAARALARAGVPADAALLISATHTHSGPGAYGRKYFEKLSMGHYDPRVRGAIVAAVVSSVEQALGRMSPSSMAVVDVPAPGLATNRVADGGLVDDRLTAAAWYAPGHEAPLAVLLSFAAHPTTLGAWNRQLSADYPGALRRRIEAAWPGATAIFVAGAVGDQAPVKSGEGFERAEGVGARLAEAAIAAIGSARPQPLRRLSAASVRLPLDPAQVRLGRRVTLPRWLSRRLVDDDAELVVARIGDVALLGAPCDYSAELGAELKRAAVEAGMTPLLVGFANDYIGYCMSEAVYRSDAYEGLMAFNGPRTGRQVTAALVELVRGLP